MSIYRFQLYIFDNHPQSRFTRQLITQIFERTSFPCHLDIIDVQQSPHLAEADRIWAIPTLVKTFPPPSQRAIGTFEDTSQLLQWLDSCFLGSLESYL